MMPSKSSCVQPAGRGKSCGTAVPGKGPGSGPRRRILFLQGLFKLLETSKYSLVVSDSYQNDMNPREEVGQEVHGHELCSRSSGQEEERWTVEGLHESWVCWHFHVDFVSSQSFINRLNRLSPSLSFIFLHFHAFEFHHITPFGRVLSRYARYPLTKLPADVLSFPTCQGSCSVRPFLTHKV